MARKIPLFEAVIREVALQGGQVGILSVEDGSGKEVKQVLANDDADILETAKVIARRPEKGLVMKGIRKGY
jgi:hypothetical protein